MLATTPLLGTNRPSSTSSVEEQSTKNSHLGKPLSIWERAALLVDQPTYWTSEAILRARCTPMEPGVWGNCESQFLERLRRVAVIYGNLHFKNIHTFAEVQGFGVFNLSTHYAAGLLNHIGNSLNPKNYAYFAGNAPESQEKISEPKILQLNACMYWGGQPIPQGGLRPARYRIEQFCDKISEVDSDVVVCQEISLDPAVKIIERLKENYAHFYANIGPFPWGMDSGLFVASKLPIVSAPQFYPFSNQPRVLRGYFCFETPKFWVITTHMHPAVAEIRREQLAEITDKIDELQNTTGKPCILIGDLNIGHSANEDGEYVSSGIRDMYVDNYEREADPFTLTPQNATWTGLLDRYGGGIPYIVDGVQVDWEVDDYALIRKGQENKFSSFDVEQLRTFEVDENDEFVDPANALTDHQGLLVSFKMESGTSDDDIEEEFHIIEDYTPGNTEGTNNTAPGKYHAKND